MAPSPTSLLLTDTTVLPSSFVKQFLASQPTGSQESVGFVTQSALCGSKLPLPSSSLDSVLSLAESPGHHSSSLLSELSRLLKPGGTLIIQEPVGRRAPTSEELSKLGSKASSLQTQSSLEKSLLYAGFSLTSSISPVVETGLDSNWSGVTPASVGSTQGPLLQPIAITVKKPSWETGTSFSLKNKSAKIASGGPVAVNGNNGTTVKLSLDEIDDVAMAPLPSESLQGKPRPSSWRIGRDDEDMGDLIDEDDLLTAEDLAPPDAVPASDCGTSKKACKNCTCGRAEMEEEENEKIPTKKLTVDQISNPVSACGSCGLGDAFRCAGCPYRGLPTFKLGEKISLPGNFLEADV